MLNSKYLSEAEYVPNNAGAVNLAKALPVPKTPPTIPVPVIAIIVLAPWVEASLRANLPFCPVAKAVA